VRARKGVEEVGEQWGGGGRDRKPKKRD